MCMKNLITIAFTEQDNYGKGGYEEKIEIELPNRRTMLRANNALTTTRHSSHTYNSGQRYAHLVSLTPSIVTYSYHAMELMLLTRSKHVCKLLRTLGIGRTLQCDLAMVANEFSKLYGQSLSEFISSDCDGDYKRLLIAIVGNC